DAITVADMQHPHTYIAGMAFVDSCRLVATDQTNFAVWIVDTCHGNPANFVVLPNGPQPYAVAVDPMRNAAYVSAWSSSAISVLDIDGMTLTLANSIQVGKNPEGVALWPADAPQKLLVAVSDEDTVGIIDLTTDTVERSLDVRPAARPQPHGTAPNAVSVIG